MRANGAAEFNRVIAWLPIKMFGIFDGSRAAAVAESPLPSRGSLERVYESSGVSFATRVWHAQTPTHYKLRVQRVGKRCANEGKKKYENCFSHLLIWGGTLGF